MVYHLTVAGKWRKISEFTTASGDVTEPGFRQRVLPPRSDLVRRLRGGDLVRLLDDIDMDRPAST